MNFQGPNNVDIGHNNDVAANGPNNQERGQKEAEKTYSLIAKEVKDYMGTLAWNFNQEVIEHCTTRLKIAKHEWWQERQQVPKGYSFRAPNAIPEEEGTIKQMELDLLAFKTESLKHRLTNMKQIEHDYQKKANEWMEYRCQRLKVEYEKHLNEEIPEELKSFLDNKVKTTTANFNYELKHHRLREELICENKIIKAIMKLNKFEESKLKDQEMIDVENEPSSETSSKPPGKQPGKLKPKPKGKGKGATPKPKNRGAPRTKEKYGPKVAAHERKKFDARGAGKQKGKGKGREKQRSTTSTSTSSTKGKQYSRRY